MGIGVQATRALDAVRWSGSERLDEEDQGEVPLAFQIIPRMLSGVEARVLTALTTETTSSWHSLRAQGNFHAGIN